MKKIFSSIGLFLFALIAIVIMVIQFKATVYAETSKLEVSAWLPYWKIDDATADAKEHLDSLNVIHPFGYTVKSDGTLNDELLDIRNSSWKRLFKAAKKKGVLIVPSIMSSDGETLHAILSDENLRTTHIKEITKLVKKEKYDGIDIDYEGKKAETNQYFGFFLRDLKQALGSKILTCTIEARTPPSSLYKVIPSTIEYANDYAAIGTYCDQVKLMTYDQGRADIVLNDAKSGAPYIPVSDVDWVRKVVVLALQTIPKEKIELGIPTYGREYEVTVSPNWFQSYKKLWSVNPDVAIQTADEYNVKPSRNKAGEISYSYIPSESNLKLSSKLKIPKNTPSGNKVAAQALAHANKTGETITFNLVWWSDAEAIKQKTDLAKEYKLGGVGIFKVDGGEDSEMWDELENL